LALPSFPTRRSSDLSVALARVLNVPPRGIGDKTRTNLLGFARDQELTAAQALLRAEEIADVPPRQRAALTSFGRLLERLRIDIKIGRAPSELQSLRH